MYASRTGAVEKSGVAVCPAPNRSAVKWRVAVAILSSALAICFLLLGRFEPRFVFIHSYEALIYIALVFLTFAVDDRWLYSFGMLVPAGWLMLGVFTSGFGSIARELQALVHFREPNHLVFVFGDVIGCISVALMIVSACRWRRRSVQSGKATQALVITLLIVATYDMGLLWWSLRAARGL